MPFSHGVIPFLKRLAVIACVLGAAAVIYASIPYVAVQAKGLQLYARSASGCDLVGTLRASHHTYSRAQHITAITEGSHTLRVDGELSLVRTPSGDWWTPTRSIHVLHAQLAEQQQQIYAGVRAGGVVIDAGANIGLFTKRALADGAKLVVAVEPAPENLECLRRNLAAEVEAGRAVIYPKGIWDKDATLPMHITVDNSAANSFVRQYGTTAKVIDLPLTTLDKLVAELKLDRVDFIKMDIEGAERQALEGARQTLQKDRPRLALCVYHLADDVTVLPAKVRSIVAGYQMDCDCMTTLNGVQPHVVHMAAR